MKIETMRKFVLLFICMTFLGKMFAQTHFQQLSYEGALQKAKEENKLVFIDCYTTWCGPCKAMAEQILPLPEVGDYLNERFVCLQVDMEKGEGPFLAKKYAVDAYPTFLLLQADGSLKKRVVGAAFSGEDFVKRLKSAMGENSTEHLDSLYNQGVRSGGFMLSYLHALDAAGKTEQAQQVMRELMPTLTDAQKTYSSYWFIYESPNLTPVGSENAVYLLNHVEAFRENVGELSVNQKVRAIFEERLENIIRGKDKEATLTDVQAIEEQLRLNKLPDSLYLTNLVKLAEGMKSLDAGKTFVAFVEIFSSLEDEKKISYLYFQPLYTLKGKWTNEQKEALAKLSIELSERVKDPALQEGLRRFAEYEIPKL